MAYVKKADRATENNETADISPEMSADLSPAPKPAPKQPEKVNNLIHFDLLTINLVLAQRPSTRPGVSGAESYPIRAEVIKVNRTTKANQKNIDLDNKHRLGLALTEPGTPNHLLCWFPAGQFKPGDAIQSDMIWDSLYAGSNIVGYDRKIIFKY